MRHFVIGTAGHIDHGKTALIRALTGEDTDRLPEEKRRGITTDLGFASFELGDGNRAGLIDVPGHEKFIHNMTAGAAGMDLVLLVIAADEGIMPQTREHMDILTILGVRNFIAVLNKCDLADEEWLEMVEEEIRNEMGQAGLIDVPVVRVSSRTGKGIENLKRLIRTYALKADSDSSGEAKRSAAPARLPVDRVFTMQGFGTVATGTMLEGRIEKGQELAVYPAGKQCRVRGIQVYGKEEAKCQAGQRAALNLTGIDKADIRRGCVLAPAGSLKTGRVINVRLNILAHSERTVKNQSRLHFYSGTFQMLCRAALLDADQLSPGEKGYAQLWLETDAALRRGDRFVLRFYSPLETIGGGVVLETNVRREKRFRKETLERLQKKETAGQKELAELLLQESGAEMLQIPALTAELGISEETAQILLGELAEEGKAYCFAVNGAEYFLHREAEVRLRDALLEEVQKYLKQYPCRLGMPEAQMTSSGALEKLPKAAADAYTGWLVKMHVLDCIDCGGIRPEKILSWKPGGRLLCPAGYKPGESRSYRLVNTVFSEAAEKAGCHFLSLRDLAFEHADFGKEDGIKTGSGGRDARVQADEIPEIMRLLELQGKALYLSGDIYTLPSVMEYAAEKIEAVLIEEGKITISQVCGLVDTSRKNARLILEYTDRMGITKKEKAESERVKG